MKELHGTFVEDSGLPENAKFIEVKNIPHGPYEYFGNCVDTVPDIWDATKMANFLYNEVKVVKNPEIIVNQFKAGEKTIPNDFELPKDVTNLSDAVFFYGHNILGVYLTKTDKHYFFDTF